MHLPPDLALIFCFEMNLILVMRHEDQVKGSDI